MNILVCISSVPDTTSKIKFTDGGKAFDKEGVQFVINPHDEFMLTRAIWFKEKQGAKITILTVGEADVEPVMRKALATGADEAIRVDVSPKDSISTAREIAAIIENNQFDMIFMGVESIDYNGAIVPSLLATQVGYPIVNNCINLEVEGNTGIAYSEVDGGKEKLGFSLPVIVAGKKGIVEDKDLRIPNMRGIIQARTKKIEVIKGLGVDTEVNYEHFEAPQSKSAVKLVDANDVEELIRLLHEEAKVI